MMPMIDITASPMPEIDTSMFNIDELLPTSYIPMATPTVADAVSTLDARLNNGRLSTVTPMYDIDTSVVQKSLTSNKSSWCLVGNVNNRRGCIRMEEGDKCLSGQVYGSELDCLRLKDTDYRPKFSKTTPMQAPLPQQPPLAQVMQTQLGQSNGKMPQIIMLPAIDINSQKPYPYPQMIPQPSSTMPMSNPVQKPTTEFVMKNDGQPISGMGPLNYMYQYTSQE